MAMIAVDEANITCILNEKQKVVIDFWAPWCGPCKIMSAKMETFSEEFPDIFWGNVNVDENSELIKKYEIQSIPTLIAFLNQEEVSRRSGKASDVELHDFMALQASLWVENAVFSNNYTASG